MMLFLDPEAPRRNAGGKAVARADFRLSGATNLRRVLDDCRGDARGASRAAKPLDRGQRRINFHVVFAADLTDDRTSAEFHSGAIEKRTEFLDALGPQLNAMHIISHSVLLWTNLRGWRR